MRAEEKGRREALGLGFIGEQPLRMRKGSGADSLLAKWARRLAVHGRAIGGQRKERGGARRGRKGKGRWRLTGGARSAVREEEAACGV